MVTLMRGSRGIEVRSLQGTLNRRLFPSPNLGVDGIFGKNTDTAVREFQSRNGLQVDGIVGPNTRRALRGQAILLPAMQLGRGPNNPGAARQARRGTPGQTGGFISGAGPRLSGARETLGTLDSFQGESEFIADLWENIGDFTQVQGGLGGIARDALEAEVNNQLYRPGSPREGDILRVKALLETWWSGTGVSRRLPGMNGGHPIGQRYLDRERVNGFMNREDQFVNYLRRNSNLEALRRIDAGEQYTYWELMSGTADRDRDAFNESITRFMDLHCTGHVNADLRATLRNDVSRANRTPSFRNDCFCKILRWDTTHCFGMVAKVHLAITLSGMVRNGGHLGLDPALVSAGIWLYAKRRTGVYQFYGIEGREIPMPEAA